MNEESSAASRLFVVVTSDQGQVTQTTGENGVTSSTSRGAALYFECFVLVIGVIGTAANGLVLYALVVSKQHKKHVLIVNQNALDLYSCVLLVITYGVKLFNIELTGSLGYWLCMLVLNDNLLGCGVYSSCVNLTFIAAERYLRVFHYNIWSKKTLRTCMIYAAMAFAWISGFVVIMSAGFESSAVINGTCFGYIIWKSPEASLAGGLYYFLSAYVLVLVVVVFCYVKILTAIRRQARVMAGHSAAGSSTTQAQSNHLQSSVIKTMILVCAFYAIAWLPEKIYILLMCLGVDLTLHNSVYYVTMFLGFLYICTDLISSSGFGNDIRADQPCRSHCTTYKQRTNNV